jgi:FkbM family methyltransferase
VPNRLRVNIERAARGLLRLPLRAIPARVRLPILSGPARGLRWTVGSATHGCWLGSYEREKQRVIQRYVGEGAVAYDVGAHAGFFTLVFSRLVGASGRVVAFEPMVRNFGYLEGHVVDNDLGNVEIFHTAVADIDGAVTFAAGAADTMGRILDGGGLSVPCVRLDTLVSSGAIPSATCMKIDVEGAELQVLCGAEGLLARARPTLFLATHGWQVRAACREFLEARGYTVEPLPGDHHELLAVRTS